MNRPETIIAKDLCLLLGFSKKSRTCLYRRINDILVLVCFERPTGILHINFAILPMFLPCPGYIHFNYGNRFNTMFSDCPSLLKDAPEEEIRSLCTHVYYHMQDDLLPRAESLSTAEALLNYSKAAAKPFGRNMYFRFIRATPDHIKELYMYSSLYTGEYKTAAKAAKEYIRYIDKRHRPASALRTKQKQRAEEILDLLDREQYPKIRELLQKNVSDHLDMIEGSSSGKA